ncbi:hypothetical protein KKB69_02805 [Patescibacteria group bacterium]|nr:hypothetical protein [Patescibacteria group bacterium]
MPETVNFSKSFIEGEFHLGFWGFVKKGVGFIGSFFILRSLSLYQFGVYQLLLSFYSIVSSSCLNLFSSVVSNDLARFIAENRNDKAKRLFWEYSFFRLILCALPAVLGFALAPLFSSRYGPEAVVWIYLLSILFIFDAFLSSILSFLKVHLRFDLVAVRPSLQKFAQALTLAYFYFFSSIGIKEALIAQLVGPFVAFVFVLPGFLKVYRPWMDIPAVKGGILKGIIFSYGKWDIPGTFLSNLVGRLRPWVIKLFLNTEAVGIFGVASMGISLLKDFLPVRTLGTLIPRKINESASLNSIFLYGTKFYVLLSVALVMIGAIFYPLSVRFLFPQFVPSIVLFYLLLPTVVLFAFIKLVNIFLVAKRRQKFIFYQMVLSNSLGVLFLFLFLPIFGILGLSLAELFALGISITVEYCYLAKTKFIQHIPLRSFFSFGKKDRQIIMLMAGYVFKFLKLDRLIKKNNEK